MQIIKCVIGDVEELAVMNKCLIEDEKSNNAMSIEELKNRMIEFLSNEYEAYFFTNENIIIGYALVKHNVIPLYLRQFYIKEEYRRRHYGTIAFKELLRYLGIKSIDIEVLPWNERGIKFWSSIGFKEISRYMRLENAD